MASLLTRVATLTPTSHELAEEGSYFTAKSPTDGTGIPTIAALSSLADTSPFLVVKSGADYAVRFDYLRLVCTAPGTGGTALRFAVRTDATKADPTGGSSLTPVNVNQLRTKATEATVFAGALTATAASGNMREPTSCLLKNAIPAAGDVYTIRFGEVPGVSPSASQVIVGAPPVIIGPNQWAAFHIWLPSQTAASSYEIELGFWER